jgi:hypothetical protein
MLAGVIVNVRVPRGVSCCCDMLKTLGDMFDVRVPRGVSCCGVLERSGWLGMAGRC